MSNLLGIALTGVRAYQGALETVADNVANAATPGYVRRVPSLVSTPAGGSLSPLERDLLTGSGVQLTGISRAADLLRQDSLRRSEGDVAALQASTRWLSTIENALTGPASLSGPMAEFFGAAADLAADPAAIAVRATFLARADTVAERFNINSATLERIRTDMDAEARVDVQRLNSLAVGLREVNAQLRRATPGGSAAAVLADERDKLLTELATIVSIDVAFGERGVVTVRIPDGGGPILVDRLDANPARLDPSPDGGYRLRLGTQGDDVPATILGGSLAGLSVARQQLAQTQVRLDGLADRFAEETNLVHAAGVNLRGEPGEPLFGTAIVRVRPATANAGDARISAQLADGASPPALRLSYNSATQAWTLARADLSDSVVGGLPLSLDGVSVDGFGNPRDGDVFTLNAIGGAAGIHLRPLEPADAAAAPAFIADAAADNLGAGRVELGTGPVLDPAATPPFALTVLAGGLVELRDADDALLASGAIGDWLPADGVSVRLTGAALAGDVFRILSNSFGGGAANAVRMAELRGLGGPAGTIEEANDRLVTGISVPLNTAMSRLDVARGARDSAAEALDFVSGVDLNREAAEMLRFQQAYQANARVIQTSREIFEAILAAGR
ncbi:MAG: flagellar hook-associated protein FlgK [Thermaurantiacus sp.]